MSKHIYFREDTQELLEMPIEVPNCYYLGKFSEGELFALDIMLACESPLSF